MKRILSILAVFVPVAALYFAGALEFAERRWMALQFHSNTRPASGDPRWRK